MAWFARNSRLPPLADPVLISCSNSRLRSGKGIRTDSPSFGGTFDIEAKRSSLAELESRMAEPGFWSNQERAQEVVQQVKALKSVLEPFDRLEQRYTSAMEIAERRITERLKA